MTRQGIVYNQNATNIGDDIQTYAASLLVKNPKFIDRESLYLYDEESLDTIISGWFMSNHNNWPPAKNVTPIFTSFHGDERIINENYKYYYKQYEPIGCRDLDTLKCFKKINIDSYFSGCLTLTLPKIDVPKTDEILAIDLLRTNYDSKFRNLIIDKIIPEECKTKITFDTHLVDNLNKLTIEERMQNVKERLQRYAEAKLVITSLIHCALPCLAIGTPVLFIDLGFSNRGNRRSRFDGILDLMNTCNHNDIKIPFSSHSRFDKIARFLKLNYIFANKIGKIPISLLNVPKKNPDSYLEIASILKSSIDKHYK